MNKSLLLTIAVLPAILSGCGFSHVQAFVVADRWTASAWSPSIEPTRPLRLTWSLARDGAVVDGHKPSSLVGFLDAHIGAGVGGDDLTLRPWFPLVSESFERWSQLGGVLFEYESADDGAALRDSPGQLGVRGDVRLAATPVNGVGGALAFSQFPDSGDIVLDTDDATRLTNPSLDYRRLRNVLMHEIGHTLGLDHVSSDDSNFLMEPELSTAYLGPQLDDIRGLHSLYGDSFELEAAAGAGGAIELGRLNQRDHVKLGADAGPDSLVAWGDADFLSIHSRDDVDAFAFSLAGPARLSVSVTPLGGVYRQAPPGEPMLTYNTSASNNLFFRLLNGADEIARADSMRVGGVESIIGFPVWSAGEYTVLVEGTRDSTQLYQFELSVHQLCEPSELSLCCFLIVPLVTLRARCDRGPHARTKPHSASTPDKRFSAACPRA